MATICFFVSIMILIESVCGQNTVILEPPITTKVAVNGTATFSCRGLGEFIRFEVNNHTISSILREQGFDDSSAEVPDKSNPDIIMRTLRVFGAINNNGSSISCVVFQISPFSFNRSSPAILWVFEQEVSSTISGSLFPSNMVTVVTVTMPFTSMGNVSVQANHSSTSTRILTTELPPSPATPRNSVAGTVVGVIILMMMTLMVSLMYVILMAIFIIYRRRKRQELNRKKELQSGIYLDNGKAQWMPSPY